ncbi:MAG: DMT family transporter [Firmicutes bacterium]|nr:DMT family transporter [Bacillota bacterium]
MSKKFISNCMLLLTALIWGSAFVAQSVGMDYVGPFTFNGIRSLIAAVVLAPVAYYFVNKEKEAAKSAPDYHEPTDAEKAALRRFTIIGGLLCGIVLFTASSLQQCGLQYTTPGKAGFITALYIVIVPLLGIFLGKRVRILVWICVFVAAVGFYLLCITEGFSVGKGDLLELLCALGFSIHILTIDHFVEKANGVVLSCIQFAVTGIVSLPFMFTLETVSIASLVACAKPILYAAVLSGAVGYTLQIVAQRHTDPTIASLLLSLESVFAAITGAIVLSQMMTTRELLGCALIFAAVIVTQLPEKKSTN